MMIMIIITITITISIYLVYDNSVNAARLPYYLQYTVYVRSHTPRCLVCVFFTINCPLYPSTSSTPCVRPDSSF